jgi:hypothetical protein
MGELVQKKSRATSTDGSKTNKRKKWQKSVETDPKIGSTRSVDKSNLKKVKKLEKMTFKQRTTFKLNASVRKLHATSTMVATMKKLQKQMVSSDQAITNLTSLERIS